MQHRPTFFFFNDTATTEIYTLSLHDALPISAGRPTGALRATVHSVREACALWIPGHVVMCQTGKQQDGLPAPRLGVRTGRDRKSTRLNSSHANISYAVFCLKKKHNNDRQQHL